MSINNVIIITSRGDIYSTSDLKGVPFTSGSIKEALRRLVEYAATLESKELHDLTNQSRHNNSADK